MFFGWRFRRLRLISAGEARRIAINIAQAARVVECPRNLIQLSPLSWVSGQETTPPIPLTRVSCPRSPADLRRAGLSLAADPQQGG